MSPGVIPFETKSLNPLVKVFADEELTAPSYWKATALLNERAVFQTAYRSRERIRNIRVRVESGLQEWISVREVGLVPSEFPVRDGHDGYVLRTAPGLYPDPLYPLNPEEGITSLGGQWRSLWIAIDPEGRAAAGNYPVVIQFMTEEGALLGEERFELELLPCSLPPQTLHRTEWLHADCIATQYGVEVWSGEHWELLGKFIRTAARNGINTMLTPLFTPPLDTQVGGERPTVQLVDVHKEGDRYRFGFARLKRWVELCEDCGIDRFEFSHLFTQWGARHAPKIVGRVAGDPGQAGGQGGLTRLFGWETDAGGPEYRSFLDQFLPELAAFIRENGLEKRCFFHVSDEPHPEHLESYGSAAAILNAHVGEFPRIDALSDFAFYEKGLVPTPVPGLDHLEPFLENRIADLWTYYCNSQYLEVSNRFFAHPSLRTRIIGMQMYKYGIKGFLHWGYNFWYSQFSRRPVDPFRVTDCGLAFPSGDAFVVYPGEDGPVESLRLHVFYDALQDMRALELLERFIGRQGVVDVLEEGLAEPLTFRQYPRDEAWLLNKREQVNRLITSYANGQVMNHDN